MKINKLKTITDDWFYDHPPLWLRFVTHSYVNGDLIVLLPLVLAIGLIGIFSIRLMFLGYAIFFTVRELGEVIYWTLRQMSDKSDRPHDLGFTKLSNEAIYVIYQLLALAKVTVGIGAIIFLLCFDKCAL